MKIRLLISLIYALFALTFSSYSFSMDYDDLKPLVDARRYDEAIKKINEYLVAHPEDARLRFYKGVVETDSGKFDAAIETFLKLTQDYPAMAQPYNNLAVLYGAQKQYDKARAALELAIRAGPGYPTAHENLGDVYVRLAGRAYGQALSIGGEDVKLAVAPKLQSLNKVLGAEVPYSVASNTATGGAIKGQASTTPAQATLADKERVTTAAKTTVSTPGTESRRAAAGTVSVDPNQQIVETVRNWAAAWSSKDTDAYLAFYGSSFIPPAGQSRQAWADDRKARILRRTQISVQVSDLNASVQGDRATVRFFQSYVGDAFKEVSKKQFLMSKIDGRWLIVAESSL